jgi:hypothetical protein
VPGRQAARVAIAEEIGDDDLGARASCCDREGTARQGGDEDRHALAPDQPMPIISRAVR